MNEITIAYSPDYLKWTCSAASPRRAQLAVGHIIARAEDEGVEVSMLTPRVRRSTEKELRRVHARRYVQRALSGRDYAWFGEDKVQAETAATMFEGTRMLVEEIVAQGFPSKVFFNPQGAKHHAAFDHSSGFCVFNDMAYAAHVFTSMGKRVAYLDWDVHHGDGVEALTRDNPLVLTASIHQFGIFPGTGLRHTRKQEVYNFPLANGDGDSELLEAVSEALDEIRSFDPEVIMLACGADGLAGDPLGGLEYTCEGLERAARMVGSVAGELGVPVLVGGSGGYQPFTHTPVAWYLTVWALFEELRDAEVEDLSKWDGKFTSSLTVVKAADAVEVEGPTDAELADEIMATLADVPVEHWEDLLTSAERDLVQDRIAPALMAHHNLREVGA